MVIIGRCLTLTEIETLQETCRKFSRRMDILLYKAFALETICRLVDGFPDEQEVLNELNLHVSLRYKRDTLEAIEDDYVSELDTMDPYDRVNYEKARQLLRKLEDEIIDGDMNGGIIKPLIIIENSVKVKLSIEKLEEINLQELLDSENK